jgi:hypothetical protein
LLTYCQCLSWSEDWLDVWCQSFWLNSWLRYLEIAFKGFADCFRRRIFRTQRERLLPVRCDSGWLLRIALHFRLPGSLSTRTTGEIPRGGFRQTHHIYCMLCLLWRKSPLQRVTRDDCSSFFERSISCRLRFLIVRTTPTHLKNYR